MNLIELRTTRHHGLGLTSLQALLLLAELGDLGMTDIAEKIGCSTAAMTGTADRMTKLGILKRHHSAVDRRSIILSLTELGHARHFQITGRQPAPVSP